ncbi:MAG TPA: type II toxin-antitoxin system HicB family antitoxin, partial [Chloroflexota bacterium]|nr:type II toxin-antitoxin system HicB family antitoxin [Chloroflexota bacterium]
MDGYRVVYEQLPQNWAVYSPDLDGVVSTGDSREEVERNMREAIPFHLEGIAEDRAT